MIAGELFTVEEAAKFLKVRCETIRRYIKNGFLNANALPGGDYRISESELQKFLKNATNIERQNGK